MGWLSGPSRRGRVLSPHSKSLVASGQDEQGLALTAAAAQVKGQEAAEFHRLVQPWQAQAMSYYDLSGECWYASNFHAKALAQIRLFPGYRGDDGEVEETDDAAALDLMARVRDAGGSTTQITGSYARLMFLAGEGIMLATGPEEEGDHERWEFVSTAEVKFEANGTIERVKTVPGQRKRYVAPVGDGELKKGEGQAWRYWRRHPLHSSWADAPMRAVLPLFEELLLLQWAVKARIRSRLAAAGIFLVPEEIDFPPTDSEASDEDPNADVFMRRLIEHMTRPIQAQGSASEVVPLVMRVPAEFIEAFRHVTFTDPNQVYREQGLRDECIKRIAIGLDLPPEVLLGLADSNHWTAWQIDEQVAKAHIFPVAQLFCDDLTASYLRPAAREAGVEDWENLVVGYDAADVVIHPDRGANARELYDRHAIGKEPLREAHGFGDDDAPSEDELNEQIGLALGDVALATGQQEGEEVTAEEDQTGAQTLFPPSDFARRADQARRPPVQPFAASVNGNGYLAAQLLGAAENSVEHARKLAGSRLRSKVPRDQRASLDGVPNALVAATLGSEALVKCGATSLALVSGAGTTFAATAARWGVDEEAARAIGEQIEVHAARTLLDTVPNRLPKSFVARLSRVQGDDGDAGD